MFNRASINYWLERNWLLTNWNIEIRRYRYSKNEPNFSFVWFYLTLYRNFSDKILYFNKLLIEKIDFWFIAEYTLTWQTRTTMVNWCFWKADAILGFLKKTQLLYILKNPFKTPWPISGSGIKCIKYHTRWE